MSFTELEKQPYEWVVATLEYLSQKGKYEEAQNKLAEAKAKRGK